MGLARRPRIQSPKFRKLIHRSLIALFLFSFFGLWESRPERSSPHKPSRETSYTDEQLLQLMTSDQSSRRAEVLNYLYKQDEFIKNRCTMKYQLQQDSSSELASLCVRQQYYIPANTEVDKSSTDGRGHNLDAPAASRRTLEEVQRIVLRSMSSTHDNSLAVYFELYLPDKQGKFGGDPDHRRCQAKQLNHPELVTRSIDQRVQYLTSQDPKDNDLVTDKDTLRTIECSGYNFLFTKAYSCDLWRYGVEATASKSSKIVYGALSELGADEVCELNDGLAMNHSASAFYRAAIAATPAGGYDVLVVGTSCLDPKPVHALMEQVDQKLVLLEQQIFQAQSSVLDQANMTLLGAQKRELTERKGHLSKRLKAIKKSIANAQSHWEDIRDLKCRYDSSIPKILAKALNQAPQTIMRGLSGTASDGPKATKAPIAPTKDAPTRAVPGTAPIGQDRHK